MMRSRYTTQLRPFLECFPREQILVETHERLLNDRQATMRTIFAFAEVDDSFSSPQFKRLWGRSQGRGSPLQAAAWRVARWMRTRGVFLPQFLRWPAQRVMRTRLGGSGIEHPTCDERVRQLIRDRLGMRFRSFES